MANVHGILTRADISRKIRDWPLLSREAMANVWIETSRFRQNDLEVLTDCYIARMNSNFRSNFGRNDLNWDYCEKVMIDMLTAKPFVSVLLDKFHGKLVLAGGSIFHASRNKPHKETDFDFFFIDPMVETVDDPQVYTDLLTEVLTFIASHWLFPEGHQPNISRNVYVLHGLHVTRVHLVTADGTDHRLEFIKRVYPSIGALLGGFDLGPCMLAFTGKEIVSTEFGAWSAFSRTIIIDTSRRSTSYEHRIRKYSTYCNIVFPGLPSNIRCVDQELWNKKEEEVRESLFQLIQDHGFITSQKHFKTPKLVRPFDLDEKTLRHHIRLLALKHGYGIEDLESITINKLAKHDHHPITPEEMEEIAKTTAYRQGYRLDFDQFLSYVHTRQRSTDQVDYDDDFIGLSQRTPTFSLPRLMINLSDYSLKGWSVMVRRGYRVEHDYGSNPLWPCYSALNNLVSLSHGKLAAVSSILVLKRPDAPILAMDENEQYRSEERRNALMCLWAGINNVEDKPSVRLCIDKLHDEPYVGDMTEAIKVRTAEVADSTGPNDSLYSLLGPDSLNIDFGKKGLTLSKLSSFPAIISILTDRIHQNAKIAQESLRGVQWIVKNPGRQWTSSINPIMADPREWYGPAYQSFRIGCERTETTMRLIRKIAGSNLWRLPNDIFNYILRLVVWENSYLSQSALF